MLKAVGFDLFGTLVQRPKQFREDPSYRLYQFLKTKSGFDYSFKDFGRFLLTRNFISTSEICEYFDISISEFDANYFDNLYTEDVAKITLIPGTIELLEYTRQKVDRIFLISNLSSPYGQALKNLGIEDRFDLLMYSFSEMKAKPDISIFFKAAILLKLKPEEVLFTGDSVRNDVMAPSGIGIQGILINEFRERYKEILI